MNIHRRTVEIDGISIRDSCFIDDPNAPDVAACPVCSNAGKAMQDRDSDDVLDTEFIE